MNIEELYKTITELDEYGKYIPMYHLDEGDTFRMHKYSSKSYLKKRMAAHFIIQDPASQGYMDADQLVKPIRMVFYEG